MDTEAATRGVILKSIACSIVADHRTTGRPLHEATLVGEDCIGTFSVRDDNTLKGVGLDPEKEEQNGIESKLRFHILKILVEISNAKS